jgi:hypothetical protein
MKGKLQQQEVQEALAGVIVTPLILDIDFKNYTCGGKLLD